MNANPESAEFFVPPGQTPRDANNVLFYNHSKFSKAKSEKEGREIWEEKPYILIVSPGQNKTEVRRPVQDQDKKNYPHEWQAFQENKPQPITGTPLECIAGLNPSRIKELRSMNVKTVEQLAAVSDQNLSNIGMDGSKLRLAAKAVMEKNTPEVLRLTEENDKLKKDLKSMEDRLSALEKTQGGGKK